MALAIRMALFLAAIVVVLLLAGRTSRAADECITEPNTAAPQGNHWYYRTDPTTQRQCWYLKPEGEKVRARAEQPTAAARSSPGPKLVSTPNSRLSEPAPVETAAIESKAARTDLPAAVEPSRLGTPNQRVGTDLSTTKEAMTGQALGSSSAEGSAKELSDVAMVATSNVATTERPPQSAIAFAYLLTILIAVLVLVGIIIRTIFRRQSGRTNVHDSSGLPSKSPRLDDQIESPSLSLAEHVERELSNWDAAANPGVARPKMDPITPLVRDTAADIEATVRLLLRELQLRLHHNETFRMPATQNTHLRS
jgi:hypothetical protein